MQIANVSRAQAGCLAPCAGPARTSSVSVRPTRGAHTARLRTLRAVKDVFMPALSSTMTEGKIVTWLKSPGDHVKKGESIVVVESGERFCQPKRLC